MQNNNAEYKNPFTRQDVSDSLNTLKGIDNFEEAAKLIFDACKKITGATAGYVALLSDAGDENEVLFLDAGGRPCSVDENLPMPIRGLREVAYRTGKVAFDNGFANSEWMKFMPQGHVPLDNVMFAPLLNGQKVVGIVGLANKPSDFNENDVVVAETLGHIVAMSLLKAKEREQYLTIEDKIHQIMDRLQQKEADNRPSTESEIIALKKQLRHLLQTLDNS